MEAQNFSSHGHVQGKYGQELLVCEVRKRSIDHACIWIGTDPLDYQFPLFVSQIIIFSVSFRIIFFLLKPFKQNNLICQILAGIVLGRSYIGRNRGFTQRYFPLGSRLILETIADFGFIFHLFVIGIHVDVEMVKKVGKDAIAIGIASFVVPFTIGLATSFYFLQRAPTSGISLYSLLFLVTLNSMSTYTGITSNLSDLKVLNSDIGRLATLACMVNDSLQYILFQSITLIVNIAKQKPGTAVLSVLISGTLLSLLAFVVRPLLVQVTRKNLDGQESIKESHFFAIIIAALLCGVFTEIVGMPAGFGAFLFGAAIPDGPPLGTALVDKVDSLCTGLFLPAKFAAAVVSINIFSFQGTSCEIIVGMLVFLCYLGKFFAVLITGLVFHIPLWDAISLGLIMCCSGVVEMSILISFKEAGILPKEAFAIMLIGMLIITGIARPVVGHLYDPSRKYLFNQSYSIWNNNQSHLKILVCIYGEDNVAPILDLLVASNPTRESPISVFILNLVELKGSSASVLERNVYKGKLTSMVSRSEHVANAFDYLAKKNLGSVALQHFTSVAPYATMHSDICTIALDVQAHIIITPFHMQKQIDGSTQSVFPEIRLVNQNLIKNSPSSVAILIDRSHTAGALQPAVNGTNFLRIFLLFLGGPDDREALAYGSRMVGPPELSFTLVWLRSLDKDKNDEDVDASLDADVIRHFRANTLGNQSVNYREEVAKDAVGTTRVLRSFEGACDLCIVGRYHQRGSPLTQGMITDWSECPELGSVGDMLACTDFKFSVVVVKQQGVDEPDLLKQRSFGFGSFSAR